MELRVAKRGCRVYGLQDSRVNLGAGAKGRSPSQSLNRLLCRSGPVIWGRGLYPRSDHVPTRSMRADDPSRERPVRPRRAPIPPWLRLLCAGRRRESSDLIDGLATGTTALNRWVQFTVSIAFDAWLALHDLLASLALIAKHSFYISRHRNHKVTLGL